jgi:hypothetical protein
LKPKLSKLTASRAAGPRGRNSSAILRRSHPAQGLHQGALGGDAALDARRRGQRVAAPGLLVAGEQRLVVGVEVEHAVAQPQRGEVLQHGAQRLEVVAPAHVGDDRGVLDLGALVDEQLDQAAEHLRGQVVDAEVAGVLEHRHGGRLPRAGQARDDHEVLEAGVGVGMELRGPGGGGLACRTITSAEQAPEARGLRCGHVGEYVA